MRFGGQFQGKSYTCKPGQMITSLKSIEENCGGDISIPQIRQALKRFEAMGFLVSKSTKTGRLITICNWERYQLVDAFADTTPVKMASNSCQDAVTIAPPNKNDKNVKNEKKGIPSSFSSLLFEQQDIRRAAEANSRAFAGILDIVFGPVGVYNARRWPEELVQISRQ